MSRDEVRACADDEDEMRKDEVTSTYGYGVRSTDLGLRACGGGSAFYSAPLPTKY